jgi:hypothetical protein
LNFVCLFLMALVHTKTVNLTKLATVFVTPVQISSNDKRLQRFSQEFNVDLAEMARFVVSLIDIPQPWTLSVDRTCWSFGQTHFNILMLGVVHEGIAFPLLWTIPEDPLAIVQLDSFPLLFHAKDTAFDEVEDTAENRRQGWQRICLFATYFRPSVLDTPPWGQVFREVKKARDRSRKNYFGLYPFQWQIQWQADWQRSFAALRGNGRPFVAPVLRQLILNRAPQETRAWADRVAQWHWERLVPAHFQAPLNVSPAEFRAAFEFLEGRDNYSTQLPEVDLQVLRDLDRGLCDRGIVPPPQTS